MKLKAQSWLDFAIHLGIMVGLGLILLLGFFYVYLPMSTKHGDRVLVPDLTNLTVEEVAETLEDLDLRYEVLSDSAYTEDADPQVVLLQDPAPAHAVKEGRKIYVTLNAVNPPLVVMPDFTNGSSFRNAQLVLKSMGLRIGNLTYRPDLAVGTVLEQSYRGQPIAEGDSVPLGAAIDMVLAESYGRNNFAMPVLLGLTKEEAEFAITGNELTIGRITYLPDTAGEPGRVADQFPAANNGVRRGDVVRLLIYEGEPIVEETPDMDLFLNQDLDPNP